ncbi:hypothetical protein E2C01_026018 [Portunus trituberculatus]|uniref:Uncharacterized protein n=1 Tax=Portunus trituberculatus TaxID=210409 RepID=A0A5B7EI13_PORTR|nr:hypothetical protein [Portunus trituberculatus]
MKNQRDTAMIIVRDETRKSAGRAAVAEGRQRKEGREEHKPPKASQNSRGLLLESLSQEVASPVADAMGGSDPFLGPAKGQIMAAASERTSDGGVRTNKNETSRKCYPCHQRRPRLRQAEEDEEEAEEEIELEEEDDLWWLAGSEEEEEDQESLCSLPRRRSIIQCSPHEKEQGCSGLRRALTSFSLRLLHTEKERPVQRILRPPRRRQTMRGLSGLPIEAANQWNATAAFDG